MAQFNPNQAPKNVALQQLEENKYSYASFIYPLDLGAPGAGKDHFMVFHINETSTTQFQTMKSSGQFTNDPNAGPNGDPTIVANGKKSQKNGFGNQISVPTNGGEKETTKNNNGVVNTAVSAAKQPIRRVATTIVLYMPESIVTQYQAEWQAEQLGAAADFTNAVRGAGTLGEALKSAGAGAAQTAGTMLNQFTNLSLADALSRTTRLAINPHMEVIFNGIGFREFNFKFRFTPESEQEALNVDNIIRAFKFYAAPEILRGTAGRFWIYPAEFDIQYYSNGSENLFLNKISTCALTNMEVNYTPVGQWSAFRPHPDIEGQPSVCTDISLTFKELEIITKERILEGY